MVLRVLLAMRIMRVTKVLLVLRNRNRKVRNVMLEF